MTPPLTDEARTALDNVVAIINGKGGVGKTTITSGLAGMLAQSGWRVLGIDLDYQGNLGLDLGYFMTDVDDEGRGLAKALQFGDALEIVRGVRENLDVVPGGEYLVSAEQVLGANGPNSKRDTRLSLAQVLAPVAREYDIILIDCPPGARPLQLAAAAAARFLLIPTKTDDGSLQGLAVTASVKGQIQDVNPGLEALGVILFATGSGSRQIRRYATEKIGDEGGLVALPAALNDQGAFHWGAPAVFAGRSRRLLYH